LKYVQKEAHQITSNDINNHLSEQGKKPLNVVLRQTKVMVEHGMASRLKEKQSFLGLRFDARLGNMNRQIDECNDDVGLGCQHAS
jgi:hypothetical protein